MLFRSGKNWAFDLFMRRGWLAKRHRLRRREATGSRPSIVAAECQCLEERILLSTITVTSLSDSLNAGNGVTLRDAIQAANTDASIDGSTAGQAGVQNVIVFQPGLSGTIGLNTGLGQMTISSSVTITGNGAANTIINAQQNSRIFNITDTAGNVTLDSLTLENGKTTAIGESGGAIQSSSTGTLTVTNSTLSGNSTTAAQGDGGAIFSAAGLVVMNSTLSGNAAANAQGGAIFSVGGLTVASSTLTGNSTSGIFGSGGAIHCDATLTVTDSTIVKNVAINSVGGGISLNSPSNSITLHNTILAQNTDNGFAPDLYRSAGTVTSLYSLIGDNTNTGLTAAPVGSPDAKGNLIGTHAAPIDPKLGPLANNGGLTQTMAEFAGSPAIDAGSNALAIDPNTSIALAYDQRATPFNRISGARVDMGAYESQPLSLVVSSANDTLDAAYNLGQLTLRDAVYLADNLPGASAITFAPALNGTPIDLTLGDLTISQPVSITGNGPANTIINAQHNSRIFSITSTADNVTLDSMTLENGRTTAGGGAISSLSNGTLTVTNSTLSGNSTTGNDASGGAIYSHGALTVTNSALTGNCTSGTQSSGGAIFDFFGTVPVTVTGSTLSGNSTAGGFANGGAIYSNVGLAVTNSTLSGNSTTATEAFGGAIFAGGNGRLLVTNSTLSGNSTTGTLGRGAAIYSEVPLTVTNSTIAQNHATNSDGGGIHIGSSVTLRNSIVAQNTDVGTGPDLFLEPNTSVSIIHSLIGDNTGTTLFAASVGSPDANGNLIGTHATPIDPKLGPLANNGGPTQTMAELAGSPAIDAGSNALAIDPYTIVPLVNDQRGMLFNRIFGATVDMGAYESQAFNLVVTSVSDKLDATVNPAQLTLRDAVYLADNLPGFNAITFAPALDGTPIDLTLGYLTISDTVRITGNGAAHTIIDAQHNSRIFNITGTAADVTLDGLTLENGKTTAVDDFGGAIEFLSTGNLAVRSCLLSGNSTVGNSAFGGAIFAAGAVTITNSTLSGNSTTGVGALGGAIFADDAATVTSSTLTGNSTTGIAAEGGAILTFGALMVNNSTISGNSTSGEGAFGGAIFAGNAVAVSSSTLSGNSTSGEAAYGGALFVEGAATVTNSTLTGNSTSGKSALGGAIFDTGGLAVTNSTIVQNRATAGRGGGIYHTGSSSTISLRNTILAQNTDDGTAPDLFPGTAATVTVLYSLIGDNQGSGLTAAAVGSPDANGNLIGAHAAPIDPKLHALANNGGPTQTMALLPGSPALDAGSNAQATDSGPDRIGGNADDVPLVYDQRGNLFNRISGAAVDLGAYESQTAYSVTVANYTTGDYALTSSVIQNGTNSLVFVNEHRDIVLGYRTSPTQAIVPAWGNDIANFVNGKVLWSDGSIWNLSTTAVPQITVTDYTTGPNVLASHMIGNGTHKLVFINEHGTIVLGSWINPRQAIVPDWYNDVATIVYGKINWSDNSVWNQSSAAALPVTVIDYTNAANQMTAHVVTNGTGTVAFVNEHGTVVRGILNSSGTQATVADWGNDVATFGDGQIKWSDGSIWNLTTNAAPQLIVTDYINAGNGLTAHVVRNGTDTAVFVNEHGTLVLASLTGAVQATVSDWGNDVATFGDGQIKWSDGSIWNRKMPAVFKITVTDYINAADGGYTHVVQTGTSTVVFVDEHGAVVLGNLNGSGAQATVPDWNNVVATFGSGKITWSDGKLWNATTTAPVQIKPADYINVGNQLVTHVIQTGTSTAVFINEMGSVVLGSLNGSETQATVGAWANDVATFNNGRINWSDGSVWVG